MLDLFNFNYYIDYTARDFAQIINFECICSLIDD